MRRIGSRYAHCAAEVKNYGRGAGGSVEVFAAESYFGPSPRAMMESESILPSGCRFCSCWKRRRASVEDCVPFPARRRLQISLLDQRLLDIAIALGRGRQLPRTPALRALLRRSAALLAGPLLGRRRRLLRRSGLFLRRGGGLLGRAGLLFRGHGPGQDRAGHQQSRENQCDQVPRKHGFKQKKAGPSTQACPYCTKLRSVSARWGACRPGTPSSSRRRGIPGASPGTPPRRPASACSGCASRHPRC